MKRLFLVLCLSLFSLPSFAAEDFTVWDSVTFTAPFTDNIVATSGTFSNNNGLNSVKIQVVYEAGAPASCNCGLTTILEEEISSGVWIPAAPQNQIANTALNVPNRILVLSPLFNENPGTDIFIPPNTRISATTGVAPGKFRIRIYVENFSGGPGLDSITVSSYGRKYDS